MAQGKLQDGSIIVSGGCSRDAELKFVGDKQSRLCSIGVAVGKKPPLEEGGRQETIWCEVKAWHNLASVLSKAKKGDAVFAIGRIESREYNDKTYHELVADYLSVASPEPENTPTPPASSGYATPSADQFAELDDTGVLPF